MSPSGHLSSRIEVASITKQIDRCESSRASPSHDQDDNVIESRVGDKCRYDEADFCSKGEVLIRCPGKSQASRPASCAKPSHAHSPSRYPIVPRRKIRSDQAHSTLLHGKGYARSSRLSDSSVMANNCRIQKAAQDHGAGRRSGADAC